MTAPELEALCAGWPGVASSVKWEDDLVFTVAAKMFAVIGLRGPHRDRLSFKVDPDRFLELTDQPGMKPAPYMARAFWISIVEPERFERGELEAFVRRSYELVRAGLSKKVQARLEAEAAGGAAAKP
ncbi:MAG TPA: MmcQ/YjbR family DNA-binding protein [Rudaea sp.]